MLWWRQELGERFDLMYLGGIAFTRADSSMRITFPTFPRPTPIGGVFPSPAVIDEESVSYSTGVAVGLDGRILMTDRLGLVPGIRLLTVSDGWVVRPAVALHWNF
jgi:hypothetical protein